IGEAFPADGIKIGYLPQEPVLDTTKNVKENVEEAVKETKDLLRRFEEVSGKFADPDADMDKLMEEQGKLQDAIDAANACELDRGAGIPWKGNYSSWLEQKQKRLADEEKQESSRQRQLARELEWVKASPKARQAKSKARIQRYEELLAQEGDKKADDIEIQI